MKKVVYCFILVMFLAGSLFAQSVTVSGKLTRRKTVRSGEEYVGVVLLRNSAETSRRVNIEQRDYIFFADGRVIYGEPGSVPRSNVDWISFSPYQTVIIPPKETIPIEYTVQVPENPDLEGTYWSILVVKPEYEPEPEISEQEEEVFRMRVRVGYIVQFITNIRDTGVREIKFLDKKLVTKGEKKIFDIDIENVGERELSPFVWMELYREDGEFVGRFKAPRPVRIFPGCSARYRLDLTDVPNGRYKALLAADSGDEYVFGSEYDLVIE